MTSLKIVLYYILYKLKAKHCLLEIQILILSISIVFLLDNINFPNRIFYFTVSVTHRVMRTNKVDVSIIYSYSCIFILIFKNCLLT